MRPLGDIAMHEGGAAVAGAGLRFAWSKGPMWGYLSTAGVVVAGLLGEQFIRSTSTRRALEGVAAGGAAIAGWIATEKFVFKGTLPAMPAHLMQRYQESLAGRQMRALGAPAGAPIRQEELMQVKSF